MVNPWGWLFIDSSDPVFRNVPSGSFPRGSSCSPRKCRDTSRTKRRKGWHIANMRNAPIVLGTGVPQECLSGEGDFSRFADD